MRFSQRGLLIVALIAILPGVFAPPYASGGELAVVRDGAALFNAKCSKCHGTKGSGTDKGPPLVRRRDLPFHAYRVQFPPGPP